MQTAFLKNGLFVTIMMKLCKSDLLLNWFLKGSAITPEAFRQVFSDKTATSNDDYDKKEEKIQKQELTHNEKIYAVIRKYKKEIVKSIKNEFGVEIRYINAKGDLYALAGAFSPMVAIFYDSNYGNIIFKGIDVSYIWQENENLQNEIDELKKLII